MICAKEAKYTRSLYNKSMLLAVKFEAFKVTWDLIMISLEECFRSQFDRTLRRVITVSRNRVYLSRKRDVMMICIKSARTQKNTIYEETMI